MAPGTTTNLQIVKVLNTKKNLYVTNHPAKKVLPNFPAQKNPESKIYPPPPNKNPSIIPVT